MEYTFNNCGVCTNPERPYEDWGTHKLFPETYISIAEHPEGGWCYGLSWPNGCSLCSLYRGKEIYPQTRKECIKMALKTLSDRIDSEIDWLTRALPITNFATDDCGYKTDLKKYKKLRKLVDEWIQAETGPVQLSLF